MLRTRPPRSRQHRYQPAEGRRTHVPLSSGRPTAYLSSVARRLAAVSIALFLAGAFIFIARSRMTLPPRFCPDVLDVGPNGQPTKTICQQRIARENENLERRRTLALVGGIGCLVAASALGCVPAATRRSDRVHPPHATV